jgi:ABC-2 type transport system ATP-binding protein
MTELMKIIHLQKYYDLNSGITDINIHISKGTIHGFLGLNGSGKTTTMKIIMGLLKRDGGSIECNNLPYEPSSIKDRANIGFATDLPYFPPYLTGNEILILYGRIRRISKSEITKESLNLLKLVNLEESRNKKIGKYSIGMLSRLGIAVSLIGDPDMIILDEPTAGLDPVSSSTVRNLLVEMKKNEKTVLLSSHLLGEVQDMCQNVTIIHKGKTLMEGSIKDIMMNSNNTYSYIAEFNNLPPKMLLEIKGLKGIDEVNVIDEKNNSIKLKTSMDIDIRADIARIALKNGVIMLSCTQDELSLEKVFLKLISDYNDRKH